MARIAYQPADLAAPADLVEAIRQRRGGQLLNLDRMLLHSPPLARGWNGYLRAVREELEVAPRLRELAMCVVAALNRADYEFHHHAPEFIAAGGSPTQVDALRDPLRVMDDSTRSALFDPAEQAVLQLTIEMTRDVVVSDATFDRVHHLLGDRHTVELVAVVATYNMVSRFLVALGVEPE
jgi:alkylhydroperoxidase family enzyme